MLPLLLFSGLSSRAGKSTGTLNYPTGRAGLILIDKRGAYIHFLDPVTLKELDALETHKNPHDLAIAADHKFAYVTIFGSGVYGRNPDPGHEIESVNLTTHQSVGVIDVSPYRAPHGIEFGRSGLLYVTSDLDRKILVVDVAARKVIDTIDVEGTDHWLTVVSRLDEAFVSNKEDRPFIGVVGLKSRKLTAKIPAPNGIQGIASSPDGKEVAAVDFKDPVVLIIDPNKKKVIDRLALSGQLKAAFKVYYSPDGRWLICVNANERVVDLFDRGNRKKPQTTIAVGKDLMGVAFSADGKTVLVSNQGDVDLSVVDLASMKVTRQARVGVGVESLAFY